MNVRRKLGLCVSVLLIMMSLFPLAAGAASGGNGKGSKVIVQLAASYVTAFEAEITAVIGKGYSPRLYIGTDPASLTLSQGKVSRLANQYRFYVTDLKPQTTYYYQVEALSGKKIEKSKVQTFTTLQEALVISGIQAYSTNSTFTKFEWSTNHGATSTLYYGIDSSHLDQTAATAQDGNTLHLAYAEQLKPGTTYYYQVVAKDAYGNYAKSDVYKFTTMPDEALVINGIQAYSTNSTFTKFEWSTNLSAASTLYYGIDPSNLDQTATTAQDGNTLHLAYAEQLKPGTTYYYQVVAKDAFGHYVKSDVYTFTTVSETKI